MRRYRDDKRELIIKAADKILHTAGYYRMTLSQIADTASIPRGSIFYHFKTKDEIVYNVLLDAFERLKSYIRANRNNSLHTSSTRLVLFVNDYLLGEKTPLGTFINEIRKSPHEKLQLQLKNTLDTIVDYIVELLRDRYSKFDGIGDNSIYNSIFVSHAVNIVNQIHGQLLLSDQLTAIQEYDLTVGMGEIPEEEFSNLRKQVELNRLNNIN